MDETEKLLWKGRSSQLTNIPKFIMCAAVVLLAVPARIALERFELTATFVTWLPVGIAVLGVLMCLWYYFETYLNTYEITTERYIEHFGVINRDIEEIELYRVKDATAPRPFFLRLFGLGNVRILSSDKTAPDVTVYAIKKCQVVRELLRKQVEIARVKKGVRELD